VVSLLTVLNHLTQVSMPRGSNTQTRTFNYNSGTTVLGFLQSASNPENGTVTYTYGNNLLATKTDAKGQQLIYGYDGYNRLISVSLAATYTCHPPPQSCNPPPPTVLRTYYYDTNPLDNTGFSQNILGRLAAVQYPAQSGVQMNDMYSYTGTGTTGTGLPAAKRLQVNQTVEYTNNNNQRENSPVTVNLNATYTYNDEGEMTAVTYPSTGFSTAPVAGGSYEYTYDSMYRLGGMTTSSGSTVVNNVSYNAANQLLTMSYGLAETRSYNVLNQLTNITVGSTENLTYNYPTGSNIGKVSSMYNAVSGETVTYAYDSLNRLLTASGSGWGEQYGFDGFGNLLSKTVVTSGSGPSLSQTVNPASNQINGYPYDANGNTSAIYNNGLTYDLGYDPENRLVGVTQSSNNTNLGTYYYDTQNRRIWIWAGAKDSLGNTTSYTVNMYTPGGQKLGAYLFVPGTTTQNSLDVAMINVTLSSSDQYFGSRRLAVIDQLGSAGNNGTSLGTYYPWGEVKGSTNPQNTWGFATYWQDSVSGLDYAHNRYYNNAYGRFMTPDPYQATASSPSDPKNPQSWNRYAYVAGDPVNSNDPTGQLEPFCDPDYGCEDGGGDVSWGPCNTIYVDGFQQPNPCYFLPVFFAPQPKPTQPAPYLAGFELVGDCYDRSANAFGQAGGAAVDDLTFQPITQYGTAYQGPLTITETNQVIKGNTTSINSTWIVSGGETFTDNISSGGQSAFQELESYFVNGSKTPETIDWFYGGVYAVLGVYATPSTVIINGTVPVNKNGSPHYCDQPTSIQNK
jgi:RHS repeat-associated protein